jgi:hypothetical protein
MMPQSSSRRTAPRTKSRRQPRPTIEPSRLYSRAEAALAIGCAVITIIRADERGHLLGYRVGRRRQYSGEQLMAWLSAGGRTGRSARDVEAERERAA